MDKSLYTYRYYRGFTQCILFFLFICFLEAWLMPTKCFFSLFFSPLSLLTTVPRSILHFHSHLSSSHLFFLSDQQPMISTINHRPNHSLDLILTPHRFRSHIYMHQCKSLVFCLQFFIAVINIFFLLWFLFYFFFIFHHAWSFQFQNTERSPFICISQSSITLFGNAVQIVFPKNLNFFC